jgi:hypothetical protein
MVRGSHREFGSWKRALHPPDFAALRRATSPRKRGEVKTKE